MSYDSWKGMTFRNVNKNIEAVCIEDRVSCGGSRTVVVKDQNGVKHELFRFGSYPSNDSVNLHVKTCDGWEYHWEHGNKWHSFVEPNWEQYLTTQSA